MNKSLRLPRGYALRRRINLLVDKPLGTLQVLYDFRPLGFVVVIGAVKRLLAPSVEIMFAVEVLVEE